MKKKLFTGLLGVMILSTVLLVSVNQIYAQEEETPASDPNEDRAVLIVLGASAIGALTIPLFGYATQSTTPPKEGEQPKPPEPFNTRQYVLAVIINIPAVLMLTLSELQIIDPAAVATLQGQTILAIMVFVNSLGVEFGKSRISHALKNR
jgi:hypothetical protein